MKQMLLFGGSENVPQSPEQLLKNREKPNPFSPVVASFGAGRNSTAMLILCQKLRIKVDLILFADTGGELPETYAFIELFSQWLKNNGMPEVTVVKRQESKNNIDRVNYRSAVRVLKFLLTKKCNQPIPWAIWWVKVCSSSYSTLEEECLVLQTLPSVAFGRKGCSQKWKAEPQERFIKKWRENMNIPKDVPTRHLKGIHAKEVYRLIDKQGRFKFDHPEVRNEYPLVEHGLDDWACEVLIKSVNLPIPPKSSCFFCPNRKIKEVNDLHPEVKLRGELIEQVAINGEFWRGESSIAKGLGRRFRWSEIGQLTDLEKAALAFSEQKICNCVD